MLKGYPMSEAKAPRAKRYRPNNAKVVSEARRRKAAAGYRRLQVWMKPETRVAIKDALQRLGEDEVRETLSAAVIASTVAKDKDVAAVLQCAAPIKKDEA
jgi:hypothetical protein